MSLSKNKTDEYYMGCALELAKNGNACSPNPQVGCVIVRDGEVIGRGWHDCCGGPHAEVAAVRDAGGVIEGAEVFVTLEPCSHFGKTPPCADMLVEKRAARVVAGIMDPNPKVAGRGLEKLRAAGIEVRCGVLEEECRWANRGFLRRITSGRPWVTIKCASSLDGRIALANGESKWITGEESRRRVHAMRAANDAVVTGVGTVLADNPMLTVRQAPGKTPMRVVFDRRLRTPVSAKMLSEDGVVIFTSGDADEGRGEMLWMTGAHVEWIDHRADFLAESLKRLGKMGVNYLMVEAGPTLTSAFIESELCDELALFMAPKIIGAGRSFTDGLKIERLAEAHLLQNIEIERCGEDLLIKGRFKCSPDL